MQKADSLLVPICGECNRFPRIRNKTYCCVCAQGLHSPIAAPQPCYVITMDPSSPKFNTLKQSFISRWYRHGGRNVKVIGIVAMHNPIIYQKYLTYQRILYQQMKSTLYSAHDAWHHHTSLVLNERRFYLRDAPSYTCQKIVTQSMVSDVEGTQQQQILQPCGDPNCSLCQLILNGVSSTSDDQQVLLSYEPKLSSKENALDSDEGENVEKKKEGDKDINNEGLTTRQIKVAIVCRATIGRSAYCATTPCPPAANWSFQMTTASGRRTTLPAQSLVIEGLQRDTEVAVATVDAVLPCYIVVFSVV